MVYDSPIYFFRYPFIKASISGLHVIDRNSLTFCYDTNQPAISITQNKDFIWIDFINNFL